MVDLQALIEFLEKSKATKLEIFRDEILRTYGLRLVRETRGATFVVDTRIDPSDLSCSVDAMGRLVDDELHRLADKLSDVRLDTRPQTGTPRVMWMGDPIDVAVLFQQCAEVANAAFHMGCADPCGICRMYLGACSPRPSRDEADALVLEVARHWYSVRHEWPFFFPEELKELMDAMPRLPILAAELQPGPCGPGEGAGDS